MSPARQKKILLVILGLGLSVVALYFLLWLPREPKLENKPVSYWIVQLDTTQSNRALQLIESLGAKKIPQFQRALRPVSTFEKEYSYRYARSSKSVRKFLPKPTVRSDSPHRYRSNALRYLQKLGPDAAVLVPEIVTWLSDSKVGDDAFRLLQSLGPAAEKALPSIRPFLSHSDQSTRLHAAHAVYKIGGDSSAALAVYEREVQEAKDLNGFYYVIRYIEAMGADARPLLPKLREVRKSYDQGRGGANGYELRFYLDNLINKLDLLP